MAEGLSNREYAARRGVSEAAVRKARQGRIADAVLSDGSIDPVHADALWTSNTNPTFQREAARKPARKSSGKAGGPSKATAAPMPSDIDGEGEPATAALPATATRLKIQTAREMQKLRREQWEFDRDKGEWVKFGPMLLHAQAFARTFQEQAKNWTDRHSAAIAGELNVDKHLCHRVLEKHVREMFERMASNRLQGGEDQG